MKTESNEVFLDNEFVEKLLENEAMEKIMEQGTAFRELMAYCRCD